MEDRYGVPIDEFSSRMAFTPGMFFWLIYRSGEHVDGPEDLREAREWLHKAWGAGDAVALPGQRRPLEVMYFQYLAARKSVDPIAAIMGHIIFEEFEQAAGLLDDLILHHEGLYDDLILNTEDTA